MPLSQKDLDIQTEKLANMFKSQFKLQKHALETYIDDKFETNRRLMIDEMHNFQDAIITEVKEIRQETDVNSSHRRTLTDHEGRISKIEKAVFSN